ARSSFVYLVVARTRPPSPTLFPYTTLFRSCGLCHTEPFAPALRFLPSNSTVRSAPDEACLVCHPAGGHNRHQLKFSGADGQSAKDRKSTRLNSSHDQISYAVFCLTKKRTSS